MTFYSTQNPIISGCTRPTKLYFIHQSLYCSLLCSSTAVCSLFQKAARKSTAFCFFQRKEKSSKSILSQFVVHNTIRELVCSKLCVLTIYRQGVFMILLSCFFVFLVFFLISHKVIANFNTNKPFFFICKSR